MQSPNRDLPSKEYAPQDTYRSYDPMTTYDGGINFTGNGIVHERISHEANIVRANGGVESLDSMVDSTGQYQSDGK